jgi:hypothetical protein
MFGIGDWFGRHFLAPFEMLREGGVLVVMLAFIWLLYPFALQTAFHPSDAVGFQEWIQDLPISHYLTRRELEWGEASALFALAFLAVVHFLVLLLIYRRVQHAFSTWLLALVLIGGIANGIWWLKTGYFDMAGALAGLSPVAIIIACEAIFEHLGQNFVFGKGVRPPGYAGVI